MPRKKKGETADEFVENEAEGVILNEIVNVAKKEAKELVQDWLLIGREVRDRIHHVMKEMGYTDTAQFLSDAVEFFRHKDYYIEAIEENERLNKLLSIYRTAASPRLEKLFKLRTIKKLLVYSKLLGLKGNQMVSLIKSFNEV